MKKRLKKKLTSPKFNLIQQAKRQKLKRRGRKTIFYEMVPIGREDRLELEKDGHMGEYPYATHWFVEIKDLVITIYDKDMRTTESLSTAEVYLCNEKGKTRQKSTLLTSFTVKKPQNTENKPFQKSPSI